MIINPAIIALVSGSVLIAAFAVYALVTALQILNQWDIGSGSEGQLALERKTYLISTIFSYLLGFELFSLFLFVYTADHIHDLFVGAMCAAGSLNVNEFGYATLAAVISFISSYYYELPTHHCPFCLLQKDYHYIGYPLYLSLFLAGITGMAAGVIEMLKGPRSLSAVLPTLQKRLCLISLAAFLIFTLIASYPMIFGDFVLVS